MKRFGLAVLALALSVGLAAGQTSSTRIRGSVEKVENDVVTVKTTRGETALLKLAPNYSVSAVVKKTAADIKPGDFIGAGAKPQADGTLQGIQIVIFPEAQRGTGEGHRDWSVLPESTMTNATVAQSVSATNGASITLKYKDGEKQLMIGPDANVITTEPAAKEELKVGVELVTTATKNEDGSYTAVRLTIGRNGVAPPL